MEDINTEDIIINDKIEEQEKNIEKRKKNSII